MTDMDKVKKAMFMFTDLFGLERFDKETLVRFFITVKKNYRQVAYHNWTHGFHVAHSIYAILKSSPGIFKPLEVCSSHAWMCLLVCSTVVLTRLAQVVLTYIGRAVVENDL